MKLDKISKCDKTFSNKIMKTLSIILGEEHFQDVEIKMLWWDWFDDDKVKGYHLIPQVREIGNKLHGYQFSY